MKICKGDITMQLKAFIDKQKKEQEKKQNSTDEKAYGYKQKFDDDRKIRIEIRKSERLNQEESAFLHFRYNPDWIKIIKNLAREQYTWRNSTKEWEVSVPSLKYLKKEIPEIHFDIKEITYDEKIPEIFESSCKVSPLPHQREAIEFGINHPAFLNGDQQGLGKTYESLMTAEIRDYWEPLNHVLIICGVASLRLNWGKEVEKFTCHDYKILGERIGKRGGKKITTEAKIEELKNIDEQPFYIITNKETLSEESVVDELSDLCASGKIGMVIFDECHKCKNPGTKAANGLFRLNSKYKIALSGTPIVNNPLDAYVFLYWIGVECRNFYVFRNYYVKFREFVKIDDDGVKKKYRIPIGYKHIDEIKRELSHFMIRRLKDNVLTLPNKIKVDEYLEMDAEQRGLYEEIYNQILDKADKIEEMQNPLTEFLRLREATVAPSMVSSSVTKSVKMDRMVDIVRETIENGEKILIFSFYAEPVKEIKRRLEEVKIKPACITAETKDVEKEIDKFRTKADVMIGTIKVLGTGHTLTEATTVLFMDLPWTSADLEQAEDRAHRIGQNKPVTYINLICKDTIDERLNEIINTKKDLSDMLVDNKKRLTPNYLLKR